MSKQIIQSKNAPAPIGPYSQAVLAGNVLYLSGQIAINPETNLIVSNDIEAETRQVLENIKAILEEANMCFDDVVKCSIFIKDMNNFQRINAVYAEYFSENPPARETVEVSRLPKDVQVEISCIAVRT